MIHHRVPDVLHVVGLDVARFEAEAADACWEALYDEGLLRDHDDVIVQVGGPEPTRNVPGGEITGVCDVVCARLLAAAALTPTCWN